MAEKVRVYCEPFTTWVMIIREAVISTTANAPLRPIMVCEGLFIVKVVLLLSRSQVPVLSVSDELHLLLPVAMVISAGAVNL